MDRAAVVLRPLLHYVPCLQHLFQIVGDVGAQRIAVLRQLASADFVAGYTLEDQALHVADVPDAHGIQFSLQHL